MPFPEGHKPTGRPKGSPNAYTGEIKELVRHALGNAGGAEYLTRQAEENPVAFMGLVGRCMPQNITNNVIVSLESLLDAAYARASGKVLDAPSGMAPEPRQLRKE